MSTQRILFVDDQQNVLDGLKRMLHRFRDQWSMGFVTSGAEALKLMADQPVDLVVADMMMPGMNGAQFLKEVADHHPSIVRFILSGHSDRELILQSVGFAHQYLAKPCNPTTLKSALAGSLNLRSVLSTGALHSKIAQIGSLPSPPAIYNELVAELQSETASIKKIADLVSKDIGITAKLLQMVNSAFFGLPTHVASPEQAVNLLGLDNIYGIVTAAGVFSQFEIAALQGISFDGIYSHSVSVGGSAKGIAKVLGLSSQEVDYAFLAGLLHDIGKLVMIKYFREEMGEAFRLAREKSILPHVAEAEVLGVSHAEIGAHLLSLWGLPDPILEAIALHHRPDEAPELTTGVLTSVHVANAAHQATGCSTAEKHEALLDEEYMEEVGLSERISELTELCRTET